MAALLFTYCLIFIGGLVRVSGSGMGCPDWPTCFGRFIPPTSIEQITWNPEVDYEIGDMIIKNDTLWVSDFNFTSMVAFDSENWHLSTNVISDENLFYNKYQEMINLIK